MAKRPTTNTPAPPPTDAEADRMKADAEAFAARNAATDWAAELAADPAYGPAAENLARLGARRRELDGELAAVEARDRRPGVSPAVAALVVGVDADALPRTDGADPAEAARVRSALRDVAAAVGIQDQAVRRLHREASRRLCRSAEGRYLKIIGRLAAAVRELQAAAEAESSFRRGMGAGGVDLMPPMDGTLSVPLDVVSLNGDASGWASRWLARLTESGLE